MVIRLEEFESAWRAALCSELCGDGMSFLRKTRVGQMITIPPRDGEGEREEAEVEGEEGGPGPPT